MEKNEINNNDLKIGIANSAIEMLINEKKIQKLDNTKLEYGYIFAKENGEIEALLKIIISTKKSIFSKVTDQTFYFAVQEKTLKLLSITENQYQSVIKQMEEFHPCLKEIPKESDNSIARKDKNNDFLTKNNISINKNLTCGIDEETANLKDIDTICKKAIASLFAITISCDIRNNKYEESKKFFTPLIKEYNVENYFNSKEKRIIDGTYTKQDEIDMDWEYETYWAICWALGLVDDITDGSKICDCEKAVSFVSETSSYEEFKNKCKLRPLSEIIDMYDLYFRYQWAINNKKIVPDTKISNLDSSNVLERFRALKWLLTTTEDWYDLQLNT